MLRNKGYFLISANNKRDFLEKILNEKVSYRDISILCKSLSSMIKAGIQIAEAISIVTYQYNKKILKESFNDIEYSILKGKTLYDSFEKYTNIYPRFMLEMINAGEKSGKLDEVLENMSEYYEKQYKIINKLKSAMAYPIMVLISSILVIIFLMTKIIPQFIDVLNSVNGEIPFITRIILNLCSFFRKNYFLLITSGILIFFLLYKACKSNGFKKHFHKFILSLPFIGKFYNKYIMLRFVMVMSMLLNAGLTIIKALEITIGVLDNNIIEQKIYNCIQGIKKGESVYLSFKNYDLGNNMLLSLVHIGEEAGNLDIMLYKAGEILKDDVEEGLKRMTTFIEPIVIIFLACFIGIFIIAGLLPIVSIMDSLN